MRATLASLRSRVFAAMAAVAVLPVAAALALATAQLTRQAETDLARSAEEAARLVAQYQRTRLELAAERAALIADLPKLKAAVAEADPRTVEPVARDYRARVRSDVFVVADREGRTLVALGAASWSGRSQEPDYRVDAGRLLQTVGVPIVVGAEPLGHLTLAFALDGGFAAGLRALTGAEIAIVHAGRIFASTLPRAEGGAPIDLTPRDGRLRLAGEEYVVRRAALGAGPGSPVALVLRSRAEALRPLRTLRTTLTLAAAAAFAGGILLSWAVARTVTRPLAALIGEMKEIARTGDLARRLPPSRRWDDEDAQMLSRTFGVLTDSIARFQREAATRERLSVLGRLSTVIAHEVRNPLMIIKGSLRTLKQEGTSAGDLREAAADVEREVARLNRVVSDVLDFARPLRLSPAALEPARLAREAARAVLDDAEASMVRFDLEPEPGTIVSDPERLRAALVNLIENARDSLVEAQGGEASDRLEIGCRRLALGGVRLWIADRGAGIPEGDQPHVFEPYYTTKRTGTGLGLPIAKKIVEALGGTLRLESRMGGGTRAEIELPAALDRSAAEVR